MISAAWTMREREKERKRLDRLMQRRLKRVHKWSDKPVWWILMRETATGFTVWLSTAAW